MGWDNTRGKGVCVRLNICSFLEFNPDCDSESPKMENFDLKLEIEFIEGREENYFMYSSEY